MLNTIRATLKSIKYATSDTKPTKRDLLKLEWLRCLWSLIRVWVVPISLKNQSRSTAHSLWKEVKATLSIRVLNVLWGRLKVRLWGDYLHGVSSEHQG